MSRMYSALSAGSTVRAAPVADPTAKALPRAGSGRAASTTEAPGTIELDGYVSDAEDNPFVEVGGPSGPQFSPGISAFRLPATKPAIADPVPSRDDSGTTAAQESGAQAAGTLPVSRAAASPALIGVGTRTFPRLAGAPAYLSITFHDLSGRSRTKTEVEGQDPALVALHFPDHPVSGEYRTLRDEVRSQLPEPTPRVLLFTAASGEAGTTTVLLNLAITIAREGVSRVLVVDANVTRPGVARRFGTKSSPGLVEVLAQQVPLAWAVQPSVVPNLQILPSGERSADGPPTIGQDLPKLIAQLRQWYDWILVDAGVWGVVPERDGACPAADAVYLVCREADVDRSEFAGLRGWVRELGGLLRGFISTRA